MPTVCTSCGVQIPPTLIIYKCRQCINHFVCQTCETKDNHRAGVAFHTLDKVFVPNAQLTNPGDASVKINNNQKPIGTNTSANSSIFNSEEYLKSVLLYCFHCHRIFGAEKEPSFQCQQCPDGFGVCAPCLPFMSTHHPSVHTFSKGPSTNTLNYPKTLYHLGIKCDGCSRESFNGNRYQCEECPPTYDLCDDCFGKKHTHHKFKYIQHPALHAANQRNLGWRTLILAQKNGNSNWRDPLTGWTKSDAEKVMEQGKQEKQFYEDQLQNIIKEREQEAERRKLRSERDLEDAERRLAWTSWKITSS